MMQRIYYKKEFQKICPSTLEIDGYVCDLKPVMNRVEKFFVKKMKKTQEEAYHDAIQDFGYFD